MLSLQSTIFGGPRTKSPHELLEQSIAHASVSGHEREFVQFIADWASSHGFEIDLWQADERAVHEAAKELNLPFARHLPLKDRPTVVIRLPGNPQRRSLIFNAHSDVVAAPDPQRWSHPPFAGTIDGDRIIGRGACDTKGPLVAGLEAMRMLKESTDAQDRGDILLELIPGEEDCVGLGTFTSVVRGHRADASVVLEPTENIPCCASRGGVRFEIVCIGRAVHGTMKWLGDDAIVTLRRVLEAIELMEQRFNDRAADPLFAAFPFARPITVDSMQGGQWQGMICDRATCAGYFEFLPRDDISTWQKRFVDELLSASGLDESKVAVTFSEQYAGHRTDPSDPLNRVAIEAAQSAAIEAAQDVFNSGCEAGLRNRIHGTPTLVWGPGNLANAHAVDESIGLRELEQAAKMFGDFALRWGQLEHK